MRRRQQPTPAELANFRELAHDEISDRAIAAVISLDFENVRLRGEEVLVGAAVNVTGTFKRMWVISKTRLVRVPASQAFVSRHGGLTAAIFEQPSSAPEKLHVAPRLVQSLQGLHL
jgi:hypothetical protein